MLMYSHFSSNWYNTKNGDNKSDVWEAFCTSQVLFGSKADREYHVYYCRTSNNRVFELMTFLILIYIIVHSVAAV